MDIAVGDNNWVTERFEAFDTVNSITVPADHRQVLTQCLRLCRRLHRLLSPTGPDSDVSRLNGCGGAVEVASETAGLLADALRFGAATDGLFDITVAPAVRVWDWKNRRDALPESGALERAASLRGMDKIRISGSTVHIPADISVDLGGIAKGYIADRLIQQLEVCRVPAALINLGGNVALLGGKTDRLGWSVGIRRPDGGREEYFALFRGRDVSVVTSAASERYCEVDGVRYHHLLDPESGWPADSGLASATVIAPSSACADALSTACFVGGMERARGLLARFASRRVEGVLLDRSGRVYLTPGLRASGAVTLRDPEMLIIS